MSPRVTLCGFRTDQYRRTRPAAAAGDEYPSWVTDRYLTLPETITDRTRELASQLAAGQSNAFDTAVAVEEYVRSTITYNEDIEAPPDNQDVVDYVLFESQEGYCEYYASAMAVLLRAEGIPSRVVGGYFPAPYDPNEGGHLYREKNAHLWVEAFFPGYGWIPFEPTANRERLDYGDLTAPAQEPALPTPVPRLPRRRGADPTPDRGDTGGAASDDAARHPIRPGTARRLDRARPGRTRRRRGARRGHRLVCRIPWPLARLESLRARCERATGSACRPGCRSRRTSMPIRSVASCRRRRVPPASSPSCTPRNATRVADRTGTPCAPRATPGEICAGSPWAPSCAGIGGRRP